MFVSYLIAIGSKKVSAVCKQHVLLHNLGVQGRKIYDTLPEPELGEDEQDMDVFRIKPLKLETHFGDRIHVVLERHRFFTRVQGRQESVTNYIAALRGLTQLCDFGELNDSLIRDQLVRCTNNSRIQEKLLSKSPTLKEAISIAQSIEHTAKCIQEMKTPKDLVGSVLNTKSVHNVSNNCEVLKVRPREANADKPVSETEGLRCYRCGSSNHLANNVRCTARSITCKKCNRKGHFARVCRDGGNNQVKVVCSEEEMSPNYVFQVKDSNGDASPVSPKHLKYPKCTILLNKKPLVVFADSCSPFTLVNLDDMNDLFDISSLDVLEPDISPEGYVRETIPLVGMVKMRINFKGRSTCGKVYIVREGSNLLGWHHQQELGIMLDPNNKDQVCLGMCDKEINMIHEEYPEGPWEKCNSGGSSKHLVNKIHCTAHKLPP